MAVIEEDGVVIGNVTDKYGAKNPIARYLMDNFLSAVTELYRKPPTLERTLEVGCGEGELAARLSAVRPTEFIATDFSQLVLEDARQRHPTIRFERHSAMDLGFDADSFDLVVACEVLEHLDDPAKALDEIARVTRRWALLSVPREPIWRAMNMARGAYWRDLGNTPGHIQHWGRRAFLRFVERRFRVVEVRSPLPWTIVLAERR